VKAVTSLALLIRPEALFREDLGGYDAPPVLPDPDT
jgi:hypothetical protein